MPTYDPFAESFAQSRHRMRWVDIDSLLGSVRTVLGEDRFRAARVLDTGCGGGRLLDILREY
jgi:2-polyprenyl-3-methyl-5-hydroxy-6-metoxy-1,4-benzoquinol methylase